MPFAVLIMPSITDSTTNPVGVIRGQVLIVEIASLKRYCSRTKDDYEMHGSQRCCVFPSVSTCVWGVRSNGFVLPSLVELTQELSTVLRRRLPLVN